MAAPIFALRIETQGVGSTDVRIKGLTRLIGDLTPAWPRVIDKFREQESRTFATEGGSGALGRWTPLSAGYARWKARRYSGRKILELTGALKASLVSRSEWSVVIPQKDSLFIGTGVPYATFHQHGTAIMPRRAPVALTPRQHAELTSAIHKFFGEYISRAPAFVRAA